MAQTDRGAIDLLTSDAAPPAEHAPNIAPSAPPQELKDEAATGEQTTALIREFQAMSSVGGGVWDHASLFDSLAQCMHHDQYNWPLLLQIASLLLREGDRGGSRGVSPTPGLASSVRFSKARALSQESAGSGEGDRAEGQEESEDDTDENEAPEGVDSAAATAAQSSRSNSVAINPADLGANQARAFTYLQVAIVRFLAPSAAASPAPVPVAASSSTSAAAASLAGSPPVGVCRNGDVIGVWLVSLLCSSRNRSVALSFLKTIEILASVAALRLTTQKMFQLLQRERRDDAEDPGSPAPSADQSAMPHGIVSNSGASALSSSDLAPLVPGHLSSGYLTPSTLLPVPPISARAIQRLELRPAVLKTLQLIVGDGVMLPSISTLSGAGSGLDSPPPASSSSSSSDGERPAAANHPAPASWYEFTDTPIFPRISGGASPSGSGYCWSAWISLSSLQEAGAQPSGSTHQHNVFRFFNDIGHGVQLFIKHNTLCARLLPSSTDAVPLKNLLLHPARWYHITVVHKPKPAAPKPAEPIKVTSNMANVTSFAKGGQPAASFRPSMATTPMSSSSLLREASGSPTSALPRPALMYLYVDGLLASSNDVAYPSLDGSESMQVSLGGYHGRMSAFHWFHEVLSPSYIYSLYTLGAGPYAAPAHHIVNTGLVSVFPPSPSATSLNVGEHGPAGDRSASGSKDDTHALVPHSTPPNIVHHRIVSRVLLSHSPEQTTHEFCLPHAWGDDWNLDAALLQGRPGTPFDPALASAANCAAHTLRLPGVGVRHRRNNSQWFADVGGLKLLIQSLSPTYAGVSHHTPTTDEEWCEVLTLLALASAANPHNANQLLEIGAATLKQLLLEHLKHRHKTALFVQGLKRLLLVVSSIDHSTDQSHFASFVSYLLLDLTYWRGCSPHILTLVVHLYKLLVLHNPRPFIAHASVGVARIVDSIRIIAQRFFSPEGTAQAAAGAAAPSSPIATQDAARRSSIAVSAPSASSLAAPLQINTDPISPLNHYSPTAHSPPPTITSPSPMHLPSILPSDSELAQVRTLLSVAVEITRQSISSANFESLILAPFLHLLQLSIGANNFPASLLSEFLQTFLAIIPVSSHRALTYLHQQNAAHIFLRMLFLDDAHVRTLALQCIQYVNFHFVRLCKAERNRVGSSGGASLLEIMHMQSDIATAIGSCLSLHAPIEPSEHDALFQLLMGQVPEAPSSADSASPSVASPQTSRRSHRGLSLETGLAFCHSAYLSVSLELALKSAPPIQSKLLLDLLTLLRSNPHNVLVMASLFWQKLLLPFLSSLQPPQPPTLPSPAAASAQKSEDDLTISGESASVSSSAATIDVLVYQLLNLLLVHCCLNEAKGWQVLDQVLWCLDERERIKMLAIASQQLGGETCDDSSTVSDQWKVQIAIFNRLFQSLNKTFAYLAAPPAKTTGAVASSGSSSGVTSSSAPVSMHSEPQIGNLRRNLPAVFELAEWLLFHSPHSFLASTSQPGATRRSSSTADRAEGLVDVRRKESMAAALAPGGPGAPEPSAPLGAAAATAASSAASDESTASADSTPPSSGHGASGSGGHATATATAAAFARASLRSMEEPLQENEVELLAGLLTGVVKNYPLPERRQDVLRVMFRYLLVVLPHPLCVSLCPLICESVLQLFTERMPELNDKNNRLIALSLHLLKQSMELFMRREEHVCVEQTKLVMGTIFARCGPQVFEVADPTQPLTRGSVISNTRGSVVGSLSAATRPKAASKSASSVGTINEAPAELDLLSGPEPVVSSAAPSAPESESSSAPSAPQESPLEQLLFHLYSGEGSAIVDSTQQVFEQHEVRLGYVCEARAKQVSDSISSYLKKHQAVESRREKNFSLIAMEVLKRVSSARPFLGPHYVIKKGRAVFKVAAKDKKHAARIAKLLKHYNYQHANSRPRPMLPALLPEEVLKLLQSPHDAFAPYARATDLTASKLNYSQSLEYWKLDSTESPTRMRRIVKKNFRGTDHRAASANAATGKTAVLAPQALDLATSLKSAVVRGSAATSSNEGVDADSVLEAPTPTAAASTTAAGSGLEASAGEDPDAEFDDGLDEDDDDEDNDDESSSSSKKSKYLMVRDCVMITPERKFQGQMKIAQQHLIFTGTEVPKVEHNDSNPSPSSAPSPAATAAAAALALKRSRKSLREKSFRWPLKHIRMVLPRLYLLRESALEIFLNNFKNHFFNFTPQDEETAAISWNESGGASASAGPSAAATAAAAASSSSGAASSKSAKNATLKPAVSKKLRSGKEQRNEIYKLLCSLCPEMQFELSPGRRLLKSGIMKKWQRGEISNFDYLSHLNTIAGRSYNDINQYPVFPWVLTDYKSASIDLNDPSVYRDLSKPIGALNEDRFEIYNERFQTFVDEEIPGFMYGSHYSSAGIALYYLLRLEPFTSLAVSLQGGHFDLADRLFDSISGAWDLSLNNVGDVKELTPEFFYCPDFLRNLNDLDLGVKQDKHRLGDVVLPPWAKGSPEEFVRINRAALESEFVSSHLHEWIDLIFGFKQKGKPAVDASNVFFYLTYAGAVDIDAIDNPALRKATEDQIAHFGQTPAQLLTSPHPARFSQAERAKLAAGYIALPAKLAPTFSSQLIHYYQPQRTPPPAAIAAAAAQQKRAAAKQRMQASKTMLPDGKSHATPPGGSPVLMPMVPGGVVGGDLSPSSSFTVDSPHGPTFESERASILAHMPTSLCFATHNVVIAVTSDFTVQTHSVAAFISQPAQLLPPPPQDPEKSAAVSEEMDAASASSLVEAEGRARGESADASTDVSQAAASGDEPSTSVASSSAAAAAAHQSDPLAEADLLAPKQPKSASKALSEAGSMLGSTLSAAPSHLRKQLQSMVQAQRIPGAVISSHPVQPMCKHWFLDPEVKPAADERVHLSEPIGASANNDFLALPAARSLAANSVSLSGASSSSHRPRTPQPAQPPVSSHPLTSSVGAEGSVHHACVSVVTLNTHFVFSGGYFDGSLKCHSVMHLKADESSAAVSSGAQPSLASDLLSPKHTRSPTSPSVLITAATPTASSNATSAVVASRPPIQTRRTLDCKPLSSVQAHHATITSICLAHNQSILFSGDAAGMLCVWRVFTERHERNRPPLSSSPLATFSVHEGRVISISSNTYVGVAVSLARDVQGTRGCELCMYSVRGGSARFVRSQLAVDPATDWQQVVLTSMANIVIYGSQAGCPMLWAYTINGQLIRTVPLDEVLNVLYATPATAKTTAYEGFVVTGGRRSIVVFRNPHTLEPVQSFFCDDMYPQSCAHGLNGGATAAAVSSPSAAAATAAPASKDLWDGSSSSGDGAAGSSSPVMSTSPSPVASPALDALESAALAAHADPLTAALARDCTLPLRMGVAAFDIAPSQQHFVVAMYPDAFPPPPQQTEGDDDSSLPAAGSPSQPSHIEGRLLLFPLPHSLQDSTALGFYLDYGWNTLESVRDALGHRLSEGKDLASQKLSEAKEKWQTNASKATAAVAVAKNKIFSAFSGFFGKKS